MAKRLIITTLLFLGVSALLFSVPPDPRLKEDYERAGRPLPREKKLSMPLVYRDDASQSYVKRTPDGGVRKIQASGVQKVLVLLVDFDDNSHTQDKSAFDDLLFSQNTHSTGSFRDYYQDVSYGTYDVIGPVAADWVRVTVNNYAYYTDNNYGWGDYPRNCQRLIVDLIDAVDSVIDYSEYDQDGDGFVDHLIVVHAGKGAESTGSSSDIWSHKWATFEDQNGNNTWDSGEYLIRDGVKIFEYCIQPEIDYSGGLIAVGVFAHEFGHMLGLPDLYDTDYSSAGVGQYCLMSGGSWGGGGTKPSFLSAWCRVQLGWALPVEITEGNGGIQFLPRVSENGDTTVIKIWKEGNYTGNEYFLAENRQLEGWDTYLPGAGIAIWHVDESMSGNEDESHYLVALEQADGNFDLENNTNSGDTGDLWPGSADKRSFTDETTPSAKAYSGEATGVSITEISDSGNTMSAVFSVGQGAVGVPYITNRPNPFNPATVISYQVTASGPVRLSVYDSRGRCIIVLADAANALPGSYECTWTGNDAQGRPVPSGLYYAILEQNGEKHLRKMIRIQ